MKPTKTKPAADHSTEEKIKNAARSVFHKKGYAATRTRDIAEEAGINLALLNYYFRSKEKLFDIIMTETMQGFLTSIMEILNDEKTTFEKKIEIIVGNYIDLLIEQPDIPLFVLSELRANPETLVSRISNKKVLMKSVFIMQFQQQIKAGKIAPIHPLHFIMNMLGMVVFPFVGSPMLKSIGDLKQKEFDELMQQRKKLIPKWVNAMLKMNYPEAEPRGIS